MIYTIPIRDKGKPAMIFAIERYQYKPGEGSYWTTMENIHVVWHRSDLTERAVREAMRFYTFNSEEMLNEKMLIDRIFKQ